MKNVVSRGEKASDCTVFSIVAPDFGKTGATIEKTVQSGSHNGIRHHDMGSKRATIEKTVHGHQLLELLGVWGAYLRGAKARVPRVIRPGLKEPKKPRPFGENTLSINEKAALSLGDFRNVR
ncbi:MAG: hypothetical protein Q4D27_01080 [Coriobacteriia bacterium]|nr:hypothetical protein [Coriobacteriia bacterium]